MVRSAPRAQPGSDVDFMAAGIPATLGENPDFDCIFSQLRTAGIDIFLPFSEYQEVPEVRCLGYEAQFFQPLRQSGRALAALRRHKMKLLLPSAVIYPDGKFPPLREDPLRQLISRVGRANVFGVYAYDEPVLNGTIEKCQALYQRVKHIDASLRVVMVHAPVPESVTSEADFGEHFRKIKEASQFSDIVGFDIYAIPKDLLKVRGPYSGPKKILGYRDALAEYLRWLRETLPQKRKLIVLQAFCAQDQGHPYWLAKLYGDRRPTKQELDDMAKIVTDSGSSLCWWGQSLVKDRDGQFWNDVLRATSRVAPRKSTGRQ
jgi:hypothetical protein